MKLNEFGRKVSTLLDEKFEALESALRKTSKAESGEINSTCPTNPPALVITQSPDGKFTCTKKDAPEVCICGRGASVVEAVGDWAIRSYIVSIRCYPPSVLREYRVANDYLALEFRGADKR